jgi:hypothetical protein
MTTEVSMAPMWMSSFLEKVGYHAPGDRHGAVGCCESARWAFRWDPHAGHASLMTIAVDEPPWRAEGAGQCRAAVPGATLTSGGCMSMLALR